MKRIIKAQNYSIAGLITFVALITGFFEGNITKVILFAAMSFFVINMGLWELEKFYLRWKNERAKSGDGQENSFSPVEWFKMRFSDTE